MIIKKEYRIQNTEQSFLIGILVILKPPILYLDTNHLINIARVRHNEQLPDGQSVEIYEYIDNCIKDWCGLVFNQFGPIEWLEGAATLESAKKIAAVIDSAKLKYLLDADVLIYTREILNECLRINPDLKTPCFAVLQSLHGRQTFRSSLATIVKEVPGYFTEQELEKIGNPKFDVDVLIQPVSEWVAQSLRWRKNNPERCQMRIVGFGEAFREDIEGREKYFSNQKEYQLNWLKGFLKIDRILEVNTGIDIDDLLDKVDFRNCPAVTLYWKVRENRMKDGKMPNDNDVDDYAYLPVIPYADIALIERQLCSYIIQADMSLKTKVFYRPENAVQFLKDKYINEQ